MLVATQASVPQLTFDDIAPSPPPVSIVGGFTLGANIAPGLWLARRPEDDAPRAVARIFDPESINRRTIERFAHDAVQLKRIDHPGAARLFDAGIVALPGGPAPYLVEELVEGRRLSEHAQSMGLRGRLFVLASLAETLHAAHLKGVVHRDLSPDRVRIEDSGRLRVRGLGVSHITNDDVRAFSASAAATASRVAHMAPEQAIGAYAAIDARADVYALGVIAYRLLTGRPPYTLTGTAKDAAGVIKSEAPAPMDLGRDPLAQDAEAIIMKALRKRPEARHQSASELATDLTRALAGETNSARLAPASQHLRLAARRRPLMPVAAAAAVLLTLAGVGAIGFAAAPSPAPGLRVIEPTLASSEPVRVTLVAHEIPERTERMDAATRVRAAESHAANGRADVAEHLLSQLISKAETPAERAAAQRALAELYLNTGRAADAEPLALEALTRSVDELGGDSPASRACYRTLSRVLEASSRRAQADQWWSLLAGAPVPATL